MWHITLTLQLQAAVMKLPDQQLDMLLQLVGGVWGQGEGEAATQV